MTLFTLCSLQSNLRSNKDNSCFTFVRKDIQGSLLKSVPSLIGFSAKISFVVLGRVLMELFVGNGAGIQSLLFANMECSNNL